MRKIISHLAAIVALPALLITIPVQEAKAQLGFGPQWVFDPATEGNTFVTHVTQLLQYIKEAQQALQAVQMVTMMTREVKQLATHPSTNIAADLATFSAILQQSQGLAGNLAQMSVTFQNQFAPYSPSPVVNWASQYNTWASTAPKTIQGSAMGMGYQGNMLQNENQWMQTINMMNSSPQGQDQSLQLANTIGIQTVSQLMNLRQLMLANANANNAVQAAALNTQQAQINVTQTGFGNVNWVADQGGGSHDQSAKSWCGAFRRNLVKSDDDRYRRLLFDRAALDSGLGVGLGNCVTRRRGPQPVGCPRIVESVETDGRATWISNSSTTLEQWFESRPGFAWSTAGACAELPKHGIHGVVAGREGLHSRDGGGQAEAMVIPMLLLFSRLLR